MARFVASDDLRLKVGEGWELVEEDMEQSDLSNVAITSSSLS